MYGVVPTGEAHPKLGVQSLYWGSTMYTQLTAHIMDLLPGLQKTELIPCDPKPPP